MAQHFKPTPRGIILALISLGVWYPCEQASQPLPLTSTPTEYIADSTGISAPIKKTRAVGGLFRPNAIDTSSGTSTSKAVSKLDSAEFPIVDRLLDLGLYDDALKTLKDSLRVHQRAAIPERYQVLSGGNWEAWRAIHRWVQLNSTALLESAFVLVVAVMIVIRFLPRNWPRPRVKVTESPEAGSDSGRQFIARFANEVLQITSRGARGDLRIVAGPISPLPAPPPLETMISKILPWAAPLAWIGSFLSPRTLYTLSCTILRSDTEGTGVSITLSIRNKAMRSVTLWESDFKPECASKGEKFVPRFDPLPEVAAIWFVFDFPSGKVRRGLKYLCTANWKSYALYRCGVHYQRSHLREQARQLYTRALAHDPNNYGALANAAAMVEFADKPGLSRAVELLQHVVDKTDGKKTLQTPVPYFALYRQAVYLFELGKLTQAKATILVLRDRIERAQDVIRKRRYQKQESDFAEYLASIRPSVLLILHGINVELGEAHDWSLLEAVDESLLLYQVQYNWACVYSLMAKKERSPSEEFSSYLGKSLRHFETALVLNPDVSRWIKDDTTLQCLKQNRITKSTVDGLIKTYSGLVTKTETPQPHSTGAA